MVELAELGRAFLLAAYSIHLFFLCLMKASRWIATGHKLELVISFALLVFIALCYRCLSLRKAQDGPSLRCCYWAWQAPSPRSRDREHKFGQMYCLNNVTCYFFFLNIDLRASRALAHILYILEFILNLHRVVTLLSCLFWLLLLLTL